MKNSISVALLIVCAGAAARQKMKHRWKYSPQGRSLRGKMTRRRQLWTEK